MNNISNQFDLAKSSYLRGDFATAKPHLDEIIESDPISPYGLGARYLRARGYEDGYFGQKDPKAALSDYRVLMGRSDLYGSDGIVGVARILFEIDRSNNKEEISALCAKAIELDKNPKAMMILGLLSEEELRDFSSAKKWYLRAYTQGLPWGMRYFARLQCKQSNFLRGSLAHGIATVTSPFLVAIFGPRSALK
jgi:TPR repeat protein